MWDAKESGILERIGKELFFSYTDSRMELMRICCKRRVFKSISLITTKYHSYTVIQSQIVP